MLEFFFTIVPKPNGLYSGTLRSMDGQEVSGEFNFRREGAAVAADLDDIDDGNPTRECITHVGEELWVGLANKEVLSAFEKGFWERPPGEQAIIRLSVPPELRALPWESLYYRRKGFLCGMDDCAVVHAPDEVADIPASPGPKTGPLRMLIIIPQRSKLDVQPEREAIQRAFKALGGGHLEVLDGSVSPNTLHKKLRDEKWDIVHFIGHGSVNADGRVEIDLNRQDSGAPQPYDAEEFASSLASAGVQLAVMNCCHGNAGYDRAGLTGFGPLLMRSGVPAVVAMQYAIGNDMACQFSDSFYEQLFTGRAAGRVDRAMEESRAALRRSAGADTQRAFITPVLHLAAGYEQLFAIKLPAQAIIVDPGPALAGVSKPNPLPEKLALALREKRCIPVIGPGVLRSSVLRGKTANDAAPYGPRELAEQFATNTRRPYPRSPDMVLCETAGDWLSSHLLQWVSQHAESQDEGRGELVEEIQRHYSLMPAPPLIREIACWKVPALFYTHFDGYLESCVTKGESWLDNVVYEFDKPLPLAQQSEHGPRSLVLVRGSCTKPEDYPLVLTEDDHDELAGRISKLDAQLKRAAQKATRSVLFLGVSPRDPIVRQLSQQLLVAGKKRAQGPTYFCWSEPDPVDSAYWDKYGVKWLQYDVATLVRLISEEMKNA